MNYSIESRPLGQVKAGALGILLWAPDAAVGGLSEPLDPCQIARGSAGMATSRPAQHLRGLVVHKVSWVDTVLFVKLVVWPGGYAGFLS